MTGLKVLNVSHNILRTVPRQTFPKLYELHTIDLSYNNISDIYNAIFQTLFSLRSLNLSHNALDRIKPAVFGPLPTLLDLDLSYNMLTELSSGSLTRLASCRLIRFSILIEIRNSHETFTKNNTNHLFFSEHYPLNTICWRRFSKSRYLWGIWIFPKI